MDYYGLSAGSRLPETVTVVVEIAKGTRNKIEYDPELQIFRVDRVLYSPIHYPGDYGFIPGTESPDGDALDTLVLVTEPTFTGCVMTARPIGVLEMQDEAGIDEKVLAVPDRDPRFEEVRDLDDLPAHLVKEVEYFFRVYKDLEGKEVSVFGWHPRAKAYEIIEGAVARFRQREGH